MGDFTYLWVIENVSELTYINFKSPRFYPTPDSDYEWYLSIEEIFDLCCSLKTVIVGKDRAYRLNMEFSLLAADGSILISKIYDESDLFCVVLNRNDFLERRAEFIPNNTLTVQCRIWSISAKYSTDIEIEHMEYPRGFCYAPTKLEPYRRSIVWAIEEFSELHSSFVEESNELASNERKIYHLEPYKLNGPPMALVLYLQRSSGLENVSIDFRTGNSNKYAVGCELSVSDTNGKVIASEVQKNCKSEILKFRSLISKSELMSNKNLFLPNDTLLLRCSFEICFQEYLFDEDNGYCTHYDAEEHSFEPIFEEHFDNEEDNNDSEIYDDCSDEEFCLEEFTFINFCRDSCSLKAALTHLRNDVTLNDINLRIGTKLYPVHKNILSSQSSVFEKILTNDEIKKTIDIEDMNENTLDRLLQYIYTDEVDVLDFANMLDLYKAAVDYELLDLKERCLGFLRCHASKDNLCDILSLDEKYQDEQLEKKAHRKRIIRTYPCIYLSDAE